MTYLVDGLVEASDFNAFRSQIKEIVNDSNSGGVGEDPGGKGYGQPLSTIDVMTDDKVIAGLTGTPEEWANLFNDVNLAIKHQSDVEPFPLQFVKRGDIIAAIPSLITNISTMSTNRFNYGTNLSIVTDALTSERIGELWDGTISHDYIVNATNWDELRYFFNTGGKITSTPSYVAVGDPAGSVDEAWALLLSGIGDVSMSYTATIAASGTAQSIGFYDLTTIDQAVWTKIGAGAYGSESVMLEARLNAAPGVASGIIFTLTFTSDANDNNLIPGEMHSSVGYHISSGVYVLSPPDFITTIQLSSFGIAPLIGTISTPEVDKSCNIGIDCPNDFVITAGASPVYGTLSYEWSFESRLTNFVIVSGQGTNQVVVRHGTGTAPTTELATVRCKIIDNGRNTGSNTVQPEIDISSDISITYQLSDKYRTGNSANTSPQFSLYLGPAAANRVLIFAQVVRNYSSVGSQTLQCVTNGETGTNLLPLTSVYVGGSGSGWKSGYQLYTMPLLAASGLTSAVFTGSGSVDYGRAFYCYTIYTPKSINTAKSKWQTYGTGSATVTANAITETNQVGTGRDIYVLGFSTAVGAPTNMRVWSPNPDPYAGRHMVEEGNDVEWTTSHSYVLGSEMPSYISAWPINATANINQNSIAIATMVFE